MQDWRYIKLPKMFVLWTSGWESERADGGGPAFPMSTGLSIGDSSIEYILVQTILVEPDHESNETHMVYDIKTVYAGQYPLLFIQLLHCGRRARTEKEERGLCR